MKAILKHKIRRLQTGSLRIVKERVWIELKNFRNYTQSRTTSGLGIRAAATAIYSLKESLKER